MQLFDKIKQLGAHRWAIGFVKGGMAAVMESDQLECEWVQMPNDRWFADPFVLDVTDKEILLLVEDFAYSTRKGMISLLHIDRASMEITSRKVLLDLPTHLSFPAISRKDGRVYVSPESAQSGQLNLYEYHPTTETLSFVKTICDDVVWDSYITDAFGEPYLFTATHDDYQLDIYSWDKNADRYVPYQSVPSDNPNSRLGGAVFEYKGRYYYPAQDNSTNYGGAIDIKKIDFKEGLFSTKIVKHITSPHPKYPLGIHTINEYKGLVVIDVKGYKHQWIGPIITRFVNFKKRFKR